MSWRTTAILFLVLLVVAAGVLILQQRQDAENSATPTVTTDFVEVIDLFSGLTVDEIVRVEVSRHEPPDLALFVHGDDTTWTQTVPTTTQVLSMTLTNQVSGLVNSRARRSFSAEDGDLSPYGLDEPQATIVIAARRDGQITRYELRLGNLTPTGTAYYVQRQDDPRVHLLNTIALDGLLGLLDDVPVPEKAAP
jgi:hypothetical protein